MAHWTHLGFTGLWLPLGAIASVAVATALVYVAFLQSHNQSPYRTALLVAGAGLSVRAYAAADRVLYPWDERYHALVAKHLMVHPLVPTLYLNPVLGFDYMKWTGNHVWLHKPPLALWAMAGSMRIFGINEIAMRVPGVVASVAAIAVTFYIGKTLFTPTTGLVAATFQAFNGFLVELSAGRRASDHVDTFLIFIVELGILAGLTLARRDARASAIAVGCATGFACLTKTISGALLLPVWGLMQLQSRSLGSVLRELATAALLTILIAAAWTAYTFHTFPLEAAFERNYALRHMTEVIEEHGGPPWQYLVQMPRFFGELVAIPLAWAAYTWLRGTATIARRMLLVWIGVPYLLYSGFATKMPAYVMIAAPAVFLVQAEFWIELRGLSAGAMSRARRTALAIALVIMAALPVRLLLEPTGPLERRDRNPEWARSLRSLNQQLGSQNAVLFNVQHPVEAMFYTPYTAYGFIPAKQQVRDLQARGFRVYLYDNLSGAAEEIEGR